MSFESEFLTIAEIAITLAGFTGIMIALFGQSEVPITAQERAKVSDLLFGSIGAVIFAFVPKLLAAFVSDLEIAWRVAQFFFGIYHIAIIAVAIKIGGSIATNRFEKFVYPIVLVMVGAQFATAFGFWPGHIESVYFLSLT